MAFCLQVSNSQRCPSCCGTQWIVHAGCNPFANGEPDIGECMTCGRAYEFDSKTDRLSPILCDRCGSERLSLVFRRTHPESERPCALKCPQCLAVI